MNERVDIETGELFPMTVSEEAIKARQDAEIRIFAGCELMMAIDAAVKELPVWITTDKTGQVGSQKTKYASLKTILTTVRPVLMKHGVRLRQGANPSWTMDGGGIKGRLVPVYTDLIHSQTGQIDRTIVEIPVTRLDAMAMGSAISYGRRYSLLAALGLATDEADDDGAGSRSKSITDAHDESQELWMLKGEIDAIDDRNKLLAWGEKIKVSRKPDELSEGEQALLRSHFATALKALSESKERAKK
jgi:hypothetical protein